MRMDNTPHWEQPEAPVVVTVKLLASVHDTAETLPLSRRPIRRESTTSSIAASSFASSAASAASALSPKLTLDPKAPPASGLSCTAAGDTLGAFAPTSPVFSSLRALLPAPPRRFRLRLPSLRRPDSPATSPATPPPTHAFTIPAICRTASSGTADLSFAVPVLQPRAPSASGARDWTPLVRRRAPAQTLDPALAAAEDASRLRTDCTCASCGRSGANFPRCPRTGAMWCSRECRVAARQRARGAPPCSAANPSRG